MGLSRVGKLGDIRVLPYSDEDVDYMVSLQFDDLLKAWYNNYTNGGRWKYGRFKTFEQKMLEKTKLDLGLVDDLALLTIQECKAYLSKLDIIATGTKVDELRSALSESYSQGRDLLNAGNGMLLIRQRISLYKQLRKLGDYRGLTLSRLRYYAKRLGVCNCDKMRKCTIISALNKFETTHCAGMFSSTKTHSVNPGPLSRNLYQKGVLNVSSIFGNDISGLSTRRRKNITSVHDDSSVDTLTRRHKGLENPKKSNRCYFNSVMQCFKNCPTIRKAFENVPGDVLSIDVLREINLLFNRMSSDDLVTYISPSDCFKTVMNTEQCQSVQMGIGNRQEDVHEFMSKLIEHIREECMSIGDTFNLSTLFDIKLSSKVTYRCCLRSNETSELLSMLSLHFPTGHREDAQNSASHTLNIDSLMQNYFRAENLNEHPCSQCGFVGDTEKKLSLINAPQVLILHLSRFCAGLEKVSSFVEFQRNLSVVCIRDGSRHQIHYRLTGVICHTGSSIAQGHYISYVLIGSTWYEANDEQIVKVTWNAVRDLQVYILFYVLL